MLFGLMFIQKKKKAKIYLIWYGIEKFPDYMCCYRTIQWKCMHNWYLAINS